MTKSLRVLGCLVALPLVGALPAGADEIEDDGDTGRRTRILEEYDADGDGRLGRDELGAYRNDHREQRHDKRVERFDGNDDGRLDREERSTARSELKHRDRDNNPPGRRGGPGTNWENPPGKRGGPGASPDRRHRRR